MLKEEWEWRKQELRAKIDEIDSKFIELLDKRIQLCGEIGEIKAKEGSDVYVPKREQEIFQTRERWGQRYGFSKKFVRVLFRVILFESKRLQKLLVEA